VTDSGVLCLVVPAAGPLFVVALVVHVGAGLVGVAAAAGASLSAKGDGRHARFGGVYVGALGVLFASMLVMAVVRWPLDRHLMAIGSVAAAAGAAGLVDRRRAHRDSAHTTAMGCSYVALLTGFDVHNGASLRLGDRLPEWVYWAAPSVVGIPMIARPVRRRTLPRPVWS